MAKSTKSVKIPSETDFRYLLAAIGTETVRSKKAELMREAMDVFRAANAEIARLRALLDEGRESK